MILTDQQILQETKNGNILIEPFNSNQLNPNSYNLKLGDDIAWYDTSSHILDMKREPILIREKIPDNGFTLYPGKLYLARTLERTKTLKHVPMLEGRSSVGRLGLFIHVTAGFGDIGFEGFWTLELSCVQEIKIYHGVEICQIYYHTTEFDSKKTYKGKYQNNSGIQPSMLWKDFVKNLENKQ